MKQKIVIEITMEDDKRRSKALKIASEEKGVTSVSVNGDNKLEVIGENVNTVCLAKQLSKKFCSVTILSVEVLKPPKEKKEVVPVKSPPQGDKGGDGGKPIVPPVQYPPPCQQYPPPCEPHCHYRPDGVVVVVYDSYNDGYYGPATCSIL